MNLSSLFLQGNKTYIDGNGKELSSSALEQGLKNGLEEISGKAAGQTVSGEVIESNGNEVLIAIGKHQLLRARLEGSMQVETGRQMTFAIKNTGSSKVLLSPLFENMGNDPNISKALQAAGIPETDLTVKTVQLMMQEGMSIDKNSLQQMIRLVNLNPQAELETLVQLSRLHIPVTEDTVFQFQAYKNYEHQISESLLQIADSLTDTVQGMLSEGMTEDGFALYKDVLSLLSGKTAEDSVVKHENNQAEPVNNAQNGNMLEEAVQAGIKKEAVFLPEEGGLAEQGDTQEPALTRESLQHITEQLKQAGIPREMLEGLSNQKLTSQELINQLNNLLNNGHFTTRQKEGLLKLFGSKEFSKLIRSELTRQWFLEPQEVAQENKVEHLYERLNSQMNRLNQMLEQALKTDSPLAKTVANVSGNIDFMNQLNQMFTYVQIPLKLQGKEANGELYVYTNKKNLAKKDGQVSALLHLDMEHLGSVDVHVSLIDQKAATRFYLEDDSSLDLIAQHIELLNQRLEKRGYSMNAEFLHKDQSGNIIEEMIRKDKNISVLSGYSFDARA